MHDANNQAPSLQRRSLDPSTTNSRSQTPHNVPNAALVGALTAFAKPAVFKTVTKPATGTSSDGAPLATKSVNTGSSARSSLTRLTTHPSEKRHAEQENGIAEPARTTERGSATSRSSTPTTNTILSRSPSFTAATIAAARSQKDRSLLRSTQTNLARGYSASAIDSPITKVRRTRDRTAGQEMDSSSMDRRNGEGPTDSTSIAPTNSLVKMFEQQSDTPDVRSRTSSLARQPSLANGKPPPIAAPKPHRTISIQSVSPELKRPEIPPKPKLVSRMTSSETVDRARDTDGPSSAIVEKQQGTAPVSTQKPSVPSPRRAAKRSSVAQASTTSNTPQRQSSPRPIECTTRPTTQTHTPDLRPPLPTNSRRPSPARYQDESIQMLSPHMTGDSLANAMVGANLAIRSTSPPKRSKTPPPLPPTRRKHNHHNHDIFHRTRSLSPQKKQPGRLLATLRTDEADEKQKNKKHHFRQPNKHHEGTRERWRDAVTEAERKRYEGVWAANKNIYTSNQSDEVLNLVVREIWSRSRLPTERLAKVWDLVMGDDAETQRMTLTREQFVVGMWFIDQILKGRNLPHAVNASVWDSVRLRGVVVRLEGRGKDGRKLERGAMW